MNGVLLNSKAGAQCPRSCLPFYPADRSGIPANCPCRCRFPRQRLGQHQASRLVPRFVRWDGGGGAARSRGRIWHVPWGGGASHPRYPRCACPSLAEPPPCGPRCRNPAARPPSRLARLPTCIACTPAGVWWVGRGGGGGAPLAPSGWGGVSGVGGGDMARCWCGSLASLVLSLLYITQRRRPLPANCPFRCRLPRPGLRHCQASRSVPRFVRWGGGGRRGRHLLVGAFAMSPGRGHPTPDVLALHL